MVRFLAASLLLAAAQPAAPPTIRADAREILRVVLAETARVHAAATVGPPPCVRRRVDAAIGGQRRRVEESERPVAPPATGTTLGSQSVTVVDLSEIRFSPFVDWQRPAAVNNGYFGNGGELPEAETQSLQAAERAVLVAPRQPRAVRRIDQAWLRAPLAFCTGERWRPYLVFSAPAIVGDFAFVEVDFQCVLCGQGTALALRRTGRQWQIVAVAQRWVS
jgi:hypothetical protein